MTKPDPATPTTTHTIRPKEDPTTLEYFMHAARKPRKPAYKPYKPPATPSTPAKAKRVPFVNSPSHPIALALIFVAEEARRSPYDKDKKIFLTTKNKFLQEKALFLRQGLIEPQPYNILVSSELDFDAVDEAVQAGFNGAITQKQIELLDSAATVINRQTPQNTPLTSDGAPEAPAAVHATQGAPAKRLRRRSRKNEAKHWHCRALNYVRQTGGEISDAKIAELCDVAPSVISRDKTFRALKASYVAKIRGEISKV